MVPSRDLWQGIEARIATPSSARRLAHRFGARLDGNRGGRTDREHGRYHPHAHREVIRAGDDAGQRTDQDAPTVRMPSVTGTRSCRWNMRWPALNQLREPREEHSSRSIPSAPSLVKATADDRAHSDQVYGKEMDVLQKHREPEKDSARFLDRCGHREESQDHRSRNRAEQGGSRQGSGQPDAGPTAYTCARQEGRLLRTAAMLHQCIT